MSKLQGTPSPLVWEHFRVNALLLQEIPTAWGVKCPWQSQPSTLPWTGCIFWGFALWKCPLADGRSFWALWNSTACIPGRKCPSSPCLQGGNGAAQVNPCCGSCVSEERGRDNVLSVLGTPCIPDPGNTRIVPWWKLWKCEIPAANRSQETLLGLAIYKPQNAPCCVPWRELWLFSSWVFLPVRIQPAAISPRF